MVGKRYGLDVSEKLYDRFNEYYFVDGHSLNDKPRLVETTCSTLKKLLPSTVPYPTEADILSFLDSDEGRREIENALTMLRQLGVSSIPQFIVNGNQLIGGAADWTTFVDVFQGILDESERGDGESAEPVFGKILGVDEDIIERGSFSTFV